MKHSQNAPAGQPEQAAGSADSTAGAVRADGAGSAGRRPRVLLVSGWQTANIGDVAHTPGALRVLQRYAPEVETVLWAVALDDRERAMFAREFPAVRVVEGRLDDDGVPPAHIRAEFDAADLMLHGSGPAPVAWRQLTAWREHTASGTGGGKPYGFFGITVDPLMPYAATLADSGRMVDALAGPVVDEPVRELIEGAAFVFCRDSLTVRALAAQGLAGVENRAFGPDATVACDLEDAEAGAALRERFGLVDGEFLVVIPRLRYTPYHEVRNYPPGPGDWRKDAVNAGHLEADMRVLRAVVTDYVRSTGRQVLVGPEMSYEVPLAAREFGPSSLPADVAPSVHLVPHYWSLPEAAAVYRHAAALVSMECHSPLLATAVGVPAFYVRQPTDTIKGQMYADLGMDDRIVEVAPDPSAAVTEALGKITADPALARARAAASRDGAHDLLRSMVRHTADTARLGTARPLVPPVPTEPPATNEPPAPTASRG